MSEDSGRVVHLLNGSCHIAFRGDRKPLIEAADWEGRRGWVLVDELARETFPESHDGLNWIVIATAHAPQPPSLPSHDRCARAELLSLGLPVILPVEIKSVSARGDNGRKLRGYVERAVPLLPGYLLAGLSARDMGVWAQWHARIIACRHVAGVMGTDQGDGMRPVRILPAEFKRFREALNDGTYDESVKAIPAPGGIRVTDLVEILDGPFARFEGIVEKFRDGSDMGKRRISNAFVKLEVFGRETRTEIPVDSLRLVD